MRMVHPALCKCDYRPFSIQRANPNCVVDSLRRVVFYCRINRAPPSCEHFSSPCAPYYRNYCMINSNKPLNWCDKSSSAKCSAGNCFANAAPENTNHKINHNLNQSAIFHEITCKLGKSSKDRSPNSAS